MNLSSAIKTTPVSPSLSLLLGRCSLLPFYHLVLEGMALHFISSSILKEGDGFEEREEVTVDTEETRRQRLKAEQDSKKSLFAQLQERQMLKDEEFEANRKKIFAPPPGLDNEDVNYFNDLESTKEKLKSLRAQQEDQALEEFRLASHERVSSSSESAQPVVLSIPAKAERAPEMAAVTITKKRRLGTTPAVAPAPAAQSPVAPLPLPADPKPSSALLGLASYGSDDDEG